MVAESKGYKVLRGVVEVLSFVSGSLFILGGFGYLQLYAIGVAYSHYHNPAFEFTTLLFILVGFLLLLSAGRARRVRVLTLVNGIVFTLLPLTAFVLVLIWDEASRWLLFPWPLILIVLIPCPVILLSGVLSILLWVRNGEQWRQEEIDRKRKERERDRFWSS